MAIFKALLASSVLAISLLGQMATPVNALAAPAHSHSTRHKITPRHRGLNKRTPNPYSHRKRCVAGNTLSPSTTTSASTSTSTGTSNGFACSGGKVGLGWDWNLGHYYMPNAVTSKTCYYYNWSAAPFETQYTSGLKFAPMLWGADDYHIQDFQNNVIYSSINYGVALGPNEVDQSGQANIDVGTGLWVWETYILPLRQSKGYYLVSPSTTSNPATGLPWMTQWYNALSDDQKPDAIAVHYYGPTFAGFQSWVNTMASTFPGKKLWITEFACTDFSYQVTCDVESFVAQAIPFLDNHPAVEAYFPYGFVPNMNGVQQDNSCINPGNGVLTDVGNRYVGKY